MRIVKIIGSDRCLCVQASEDDKAIDVIFLLDSEQVVPLKVSEKPDGSEARDIGPPSPEGLTAPYQGRETV